MLDYLRFRRHLVVDFVVSVVAAEVSFSHVDVGQVCQSLVQGLNHVVLVFRARLLVVKDFS